MSKYGRHLREVVDRVRSGPRSDQRAATVPYPNLQKALAEGRIDGTRTPDPSKRTLRPETNENEAPK